MDESAVEDVQRYVPGGYHPVDIGDRINEFLVLHKLGSGGFATVWLVRSTQDSRYYALNILCVDVQDAEINERKILERLGSHNQPNIIELLGSFEITGPNGVHVCLVLPVCGPSLERWAVGRTFTPAARHRIAEQIVSGVAFLHERGAAHADLTLSNVVFSLPHIQSMSPDAFCQILRKIVKAPAFTGFNLSMTSAAVMMIDFGEAFFLDQPQPDARSGLGVPMHFFPPEVCFGHPASAGSDVWELACLVSETFCARTLFPELFLTFDRLLSLIAHHVGSLPHSWKGRFCVEKYGYWEDDQSYSTPDGWNSWFEEQSPGERSTIRELITPHTSSTSSSSALAVKELTDEQESFLASLLQDMMVLEPDQRLSPQEILRRLQSAAPLFSGEVAEQLTPQRRPYTPDPNLPSPPSPPPDHYSDSESE